MKSGWDCVMVNISHFHSFRNSIEIKYFLWTNARDTNVRIDQQDLEKKIDENQADFDNSLTCLPSPPRFCWMVDVWTNRKQILKSFFGDTLNELSCAESNILANIKH